MANNPGNKILKSIEKRQAEDRYMEQFAAKEAERLSIISNNLVEQTRIREKLNNQFAQLSKGDKGYAEVKSQLERQERIVNGLMSRKSEVAKSLERLGKEDIVKAQEAIDATNSLQYDIDDALANVIATKAEIAHIESKEIKSNKDLERLGELYDQLKEEQQDLERAEANQPISQIQQRRKDKQDSIEEAIKASKAPEWAQQAASSVISDKHASILGDEIGKELGKVSGPIGIIAKTTSKILDVAMAVRKSVDGWVEEAANVLANNVGRINAALEGTGQTFESTMEGTVDSLGLSRFVKQTDYISQIANLTTRGITYNVEQRALLETIKDKTLSSFSSMEGSLLRLVKLRQTDVTATQFGLEIALRNTLNRVFKDSTYMQDMFSGIQNAITDAVVISGDRDVTEYSSVMQTWMGAMYESGVDSGTVSKIANALNALGSGNVSALASDSDLQRLVLLSMDTIGMDYADILQQGLSTSDINELLTAVVKYLTQIEANTKDNNVLTSSYTQLFGMSMADLQAFKNLSNKMGGLTYVNQGSALSMVSNELQQVQSTSRTVVAEQIQNVMDNARFTFGSSIAKDASSYLSWKISNVIVDVANQISASPAAKMGSASLIVKGAGALAELNIIRQEFKGLLSTLRAIPSLMTGPGRGLETLINGAPSYGGNSTSISATITSNGSNFKTVNTMSSIKSSNEYQKEYASYSGKSWDSDEAEADPILEKLKELDKLKMKNEAGKEAFAVFLTGMTDDTLRSFASIFADENAMESTFTGENKVLKDNLFQYAGDESSNSTKDNKTNTNTANAVAL